MQRADTSDAKKTHLRNVKYCTEIAELTLRSLISKQAITVFNTLSELSLNIKKLLCQNGQEWDHIKASLILIV